MKRLIALFAFLSAILATSFCYADSGGVSGQYKYDGENIDGVEVELYKIADFDGSEFQFEEAYSTYSIDITTLTNSELGEYGQLLATVENEPAATTQTTNGAYNFYGMEEGIWLVTFKDIKIGDYTFTALPIVLTMPDLNENYQIELTTKLEKSCPDCVEPEPEPEKPTPVNTFDAIRKYLMMLGVCIIVEALMVYAIIKEREKKDPNEEK